MKCNTSLSENILDDANVLGSSAQDVRQDGQNVADCMGFATIDRQQVMNGGRAIQHANSIAELIDEFCCVFNRGGKKGKDKKIKIMISHPHFRFQLHKSSR